MQKQHGLTLVRGANDPSRGSKIWSETLVINSEFTITILIMVRHVVLLRT